MIVGLGKGRREKRVSPLRLSLFCLTNRTRNETFICTYTADDATVDWKWGISLRTAVNQIDVDANENQRGGYEAQQKETVKKKEKKRQRKEATTA